MSNSNPTFAQHADQTLHSSPLGVRFWDDVLQGVISDGLEVIVYPAGNPGQKRNAVVNPSGAFVFHGLPGLTDFELRGGKMAWQRLDPWTAPVATKPFCIDVRDRTGRFLSFSLNVQAPRKGLLAWQSRPADSPPAPAVPFVPLYSAPARPAPPGMAALRADLWDPQKERGAAHALIEARHNGEQVAQGIADADGRITMIFPYPEPARRQVSSPPGSPPRNPGIIPLRDQEWRIDLRVFYQQGAGTTILPDLQGICDQPPATLWKDRELQYELTDVVLQFGRETVLRTETGNDPLPVLYVTSAVSPP